MINVHVGDVLTLGRYPQGEDGSVCPIEWIVLATQEERALVLSRYVLDYQPYHSEAAVVRWENSALRRWLNGEFVDRAFTEEELEMICIPEEEDDPMGDFLWQMFRMETATSAIADRVFLLSTADIAQYFPSENSLFCPGASCKGTAYAEALVESDLCWWLRSSMSEYPAAYIVSPVNSVGVSAADEDNCNGVRPAMWVRIDSE